MPSKRTSAAASSRPSTPSASASASSPSSSGPSAYATATPAAASASAVNNSLKPSTAVSSKPPSSSSHTLRSSSSPSSATAPSSSTTGGTSSSTGPITFTRSGPVKAAAGEARKLTAQAQSYDAIAASAWRRYVAETPQRAKLVDAFMAFLLLVGGLQFAYVLIVGNYPFNAFLAGFSATVGQFVLTASLRMQTNPGNRGEFKSVGDERAFADYVLGSLLLHFFCVNFIN